MESNFSFGFNDIHYSDRVLRLEITPDPVFAQPKSDHYSDTVRRHRKRKRRQNFNLFYAQSIINSARHRKRKRQKVFNGNQPHMDHDETCVIPPDDEAASSSGSNWMVDCSAATVVRVKTLHISSLLLAAQSPFFYRLFSNGMMSETKQRNISLRIYASEEAALMELLKFMYSNTLNITAAHALLDVLMAADKFEVSSCMRYLLNSPMTPDSASLYMELPHTVDAFQPLIDAAKQYLVGRYKNITMESFQEELMALPLSGIEAILASDDLQVASEDNVYNFALNWVRQKYKSQKERREVLGTRLARLIRYPYMTCRKKKNLIDDFKEEGALKLFHKTLTLALHRKRSLATEESISVNRYVVPRAYKSVMHMKLTREDWVAMFPSGKLHSKDFPLGEDTFVLSAYCKKAEHDSSHGFGFSVGMRTWCKGSVDVDFEFAVMLKPTKTFAPLLNSNATFIPGYHKGCGCLFRVPWTSFVAEGSPFFIEGFLHFRAELTIRH